MTDTIKELVAPNGRRITLHTGLFINNKFVLGSAGKIPSISPIDESEICTVEAASAEDVDDAVKAARAAFKNPAWKDMLAPERSALMHRLADLIDQEQTWDNGKTYTSALEEDVVELARVFHYYAGWADKLHGQTSTRMGLSGYKFGYTIKQPIGVCGQIIPWNYPLELAGWKLGPALACGNTVVLKPAEQTPLSILYLAQLIIKAGFPPGVVNVINGLGAVAGQALAVHTDVDKIAFTGSTGTAKHVMKAASSNLKNIALETGGKSPLLVFEDANIEQAAKWAHMGIMCNQGQICTASSRLLVQRSVIDQFVQSFVKVTNKTSIVGDPFDANVFQGPQVSKQQYDNVLGFIKRAVQDGANVALGGKPLSIEATGGKGYYIAPTVFTNVTETMEIFQEEAFGPVVVVVPFDDEKHAVELANNSRYGLAGSVFTKDVGKAYRVAEAIEAGMVWVNAHVDGDVRMPFGGVKQSGIGKELGEAGLNAYCQEKAVYINTGLVEL